MYLGVFNSRSESDSISGERLSAFALKCFYINTQNSISLRNSLFLPSQLLSRHCRAGRSEDEAGQQTRT